MRRLITIALLLIVGQATAGEQIIDVQHDSVRGVTCWILNNTGISCLPDNQLRQPSSVSNSPADEPTPASAPVARRDDERFQL
ncbi:hypothetical protein DYL61_16535 [Pseudomonas nabeulensis]|uniref:Uncharacterized protein n=1 Tax=Pseudomonas nabeulensis TaxID=2293833 RepID=A0A4Z0B2Q3_9PSED|nr:hypothetical protein [Pseudomonas nabeulensis]TFY93001.1 hypothetical protein DYL61_16535 [Pseudomonas nabeulensis]